jgi:DNA-binding MarR family transcriptional regulator
MLQPPMPQTPFRNVLKELACCYQAFESYASVHIHKQGLTISQFDILVTLGTGQSMSPKELVEKTLITKGTLTGVIDRLLAKGLVKRTQNNLDRRSQIISLTPKGRQLFEKIFPEHLSYMNQVFAHFQSAEIKHIEEVLSMLNRSFRTQRFKGGTS